jgi:L-lactate dehydrogenase complex protein LldG
MSTARGAFLQRLRQALARGNRAGAPAEIQPRGRIGYQGAGPDPVARFCAECLAAGGQPHLVPDEDAVRDKIRELVRTCGCRTILLGKGGFLDRVIVPAHLDGLAVDVRTVESLTAGASREALFAADLGISGVHQLIAETGTIVMTAHAEEPRSLSLLPPVHIAVAHHSQIVPDLFDFFELSTQSAGSSLPSCITLITGPSKTGDIELRLVTGVHGPGELHVVLLSNPAA